MGHCGEFGYVLWVAVANIFFGFWVMGHCGKFGKRYGPLWRLVMLGYALLPTAGN
jgi:hypothetical protein